MTTAVQHRRGTTAEHSTFTGLEGEVTIDTTKDTAVIHDGSLAGGYPLAKETLANVNPSTLSAITGAATASDDLFLMYDTSALAMKKISRAELNNAITIEALDTVDINGGTIDGTAIGGTTPAAGSFTTLSASGNVTLSGGTANGVPYLNGSKVLTSGSALTFDGVNLFNYNDTTSTIYLQNSTSGTGVNYGFSLAVSGTAAYINNRMNGSIITYLNGSERMRLTSTGLGIGTSSPTNKLSVTGNANVTGNTTLGDASTDTVTVNGYMGVRATPAPYYGIVLGNSSAITGDANPRGISSSAVYGSDATGIAAALFGQVRTTAAAYTMANAVGVRLGDASKGAGSTITNQHGVYIEDQTQGTNNYGITSLVSSGSNKWNIYASGTAANYFAGNVGIGTSSPESVLHAVGSASASTPIARIATSTGPYVGIGSEGTNYSWVQGFNSKPLYINPLGNDTVIGFAGGNLGLGVTPSAWKSSYTGFDIETGSLSSSASVGLVQVAANGYYNSSSQWVYKTSGQKASYYQQYSGEHSWYTAPSGTAGNAISFTQAMTLDSSGRLGIGTSSPAYKLHVARTDAAGTYAYMGASSDGGARGLVFSSADNGAFLGAIHKIDASSGSGVLAFATGGTERARIDSSGNLLVGTTNQLQGASSRLNVAGDFYNANGVSLKTTNGGSGAQFIGFINESGSLIGSINRVTTTNVVAYNTTSDVRLKSNIEDSSPVLEKLMQVQVRQYDWTEGNLHQDYGFIAQEIEPILSGVVSKGRTEEDVWQLDYSKLTPHLLKAIQEQQAIINDLKARLDAANI